MQAGSVHTASDSVSLYCIGPAVFRILVSLVSFIPSDSYAPLYRVPLSSEGAEFYGDTPF